MSGGKCPGGKCPGVYVQGGFCPVTILPIQFGG